MHLKYDNPLFTPGVLLRADPRRRRVPDHARRRSSSGATTSTGTSCVTLMRARRRRAADFFRWVPHPEVWVLVGGLIGALRLRRPGDRPQGRAGRARRPSRRAQKRWFALGIVLLWLAADWPVHDIGEQYLYLVHMCQHLVLTLVVPPVMLLATPEWLARLVVGEGRVDADRARAWPARCRPALVFNALVAAVATGTVVVNTASANGALPLRRAHRARHRRAAVLDPGVRPVPGAADLAAGADDLPVRAVDRPDGARAPGSPSPTAPSTPPTTSRTACGASRSPATSRSPALIMKLVGGTYLWVLITVIFFRWAAARARRRPARRARRARGPHLGPGRAGARGAPRPTRSDQPQIWRCRTGRSSCQRPASDGGAVGGRLEGGDVELLHAEHGLHGPVGRARGRGR